MKKIMALLFAILLFGGGIKAFSEPLVTEAGDFVMISNIDADFTYTASCTLNGVDGSGAKMDWIMFISAPAWGTGALGGYVTIKEGTDAGPTIFYSQACDLTDDPDFIPIYYHGSKLRPVIDFSVSSVAHDSSKVIFKLWK